MIPLVLVHGFMGGRSQWHLQKDAFGQGRAVIPIALSGFGDRNTDSAIDTIRGFAEAVIAELDAMEINQFDLLGHSMGGMIVQEMVRIAGGRVNHLILYSTGATGLLPGRFETIDQSKQRAREDGLLVTARRIASTWFLKREDAQEFEACAAIAEKTSAAAYEAGLDAMQQWSGEDHLSAIACKTLILWGDGDRTYPWSQTQLLWQSIHGAQLAVLPECAHAVHLEKPELFNKIVQEFLET